MDDTNNTANVVVACALVVAGAAITWLCFRKVDRILNKDDALWIENVTPEVQN